MSHPSPSLDDMPTSQLLKLIGSVRETIQERNRFLNAGRCPYCKKPLETHTCRYSDPSRRDPSAPGDNRTVKEFFTPLSRSVMARGRRGERRIR